jgi:hypothetical protein
MSTKFAVSSDIVAARNLSRRLAGLPASDGDPSTSPYVRLASAQAAVAEPRDEELSFETWDDFLDWGIGRAGAAAGLMVDPQGFVIGSRGRVPEDGFEGTGAELSYVMGHADDMNPEMGDLRFIELGFRNRRLSASRLQAEDVEGFVLAFIDAESLTDRAWRSILRQLERSAANLR